MYKIYINGTPLVLLSQEEAKDSPAKGKTHLLARYAGKKKFLPHFIDMLEKTDRYDSIALYSDNLKSLWKDFKSHFQILKAAGGLVFNEKEEALFIFRRGSWDLPKGKIDEGESKKEAAIREVQEETGLKEVLSDRKLYTSYHTYRLPNGSRILKPTYWYLMHTTEHKLTPQKEEDIEQAVWMKVDDFLEEKSPVYANILELLHGYKRIA